MLLSRFQTQGILACTAAALLVVAVHAALRRRRVASQPVFTLPSAAVIALAAARGWPRKAVEPYASLLTLQGAGPVVRSGVPKARVRVVFSPAHDRRSHRSDANIEAVWCQRLAAAEATGG